MKKYFYVLLIITVLFTGVGITGMRGPYEGRYSNRDRQQQFIGIELGAIFIERFAEDSDAGPENGPLKTSAYGKVRQTVAYHSWEASAHLSNSALDFYGNWAGYADVPNKRPDTDSSNPDFQGTVDEDFSRSDTDWWAHLNISETIEESDAWATINAKQVFNVRHDWSSYAHVPF